MKSKLSVKTGDKLHGFKVIGIKSFPNLAGDAILLEYEKTGTPLLHFSTEDEENLGGLLVPTPPPDDTGLPHIMEHSVLAGSGKYPVRDPFFEMVKTSLATFINAMTYQDFTVYPFSSVVKKDLFNLADVYCDAVFHPLLDEKSFMREAWHYRPNHDKSGKWTINGIVYNEMKSGYSQPESILWRELAQNLFPDSPLAFDSGGWPDAIPSLTYEKFLAFHKNNYHPSNILIFCYGNISTEDYCSFFSERLMNFERTIPTTDFKSQQRWKSAKEVSSSYAIGGDEPVSGRTYHTLAWIAGNIKNPLEYIALMVVIQVLTGHDGAPLKKALVDSRLGADLAMNLVYPYGPEILFSTGLKGSEPGKKEDFLKLVLSTLEQSKAEAFNAQSVQSAVRQLSYRYLERSPYYILQMISGLAPFWIHNKDPFGFLDIRSLLGEVQQRAGSDPSWLPTIIDERLLNNNHRILLTLKPEPGLETRLAQKREEQIASILGSMTEQKRHEVEEKAKQIDELNNQADPPELLNKLPKLSISDLPDEPWKIPSSIRKLDMKSTFIFNDMPTNGICYFTLDADISGLPEYLFPYLPVFRELFNKMGTQKSSFSEMAVKKSAAARNITCYPHFISRADEKGVESAHMRFSVVTLEETFDQAAELLRELMTSLDPSDMERMADINKQYFSAFQDRFLDDGSSISRIHARRASSCSGYLEYLMNGAPGFKTAKKLVSDFKGQKETVLKAVQEISKAILHSGAWTVSYTGPHSCQPKAENFVKGFLPSQKSGPAIICGLPAIILSGKIRDGIAVPIRTSYSMTIMPVCHMSHPDSALLQVGASALSNDYWLTQVRLKGNAYGARIGYDPFNASLELMSYADPDFTKTWKVFQGIPDWLSTDGLNQERLGQMIIGTVRNYLNPMKPEGAGNIALNRYLSGETQDMRGNFYRAILSSKAEKVRQVLQEQISSNMDKVSFCVVSSSEWLEKIRQSVDKTLTIEEILASEKK